MMYLFVLVSVSWLQEPKELEKDPFSSQKYFFLSIQTTFFDTFMHYCIIWRMNAHKSTQILLVHAPNYSLSAPKLLLSRTVFAETDGIALLDEDDAVEAVADEEDG